MKLFIQENNNDPTCFEASSLTECITYALNCLADCWGSEATDDMLPDHLEIFSKLATNYSDHIYEGSSSVAWASGLSCMMDKIVMCYGYDTWEEFEKDQEKLGTQRSSNDQ